MAGITVTPARFNSRRLRHAQGVLDRGLERHLHVIAKAVVPEVRRNLSGRILQVRTRRLWASWRYHVKRLKDMWVLTMGSRSPYSRIHDKGGWTGRGHKTKIPKRSYATKALVAKKPMIRRELKKFTARIVRG